MAQQFGMFGPMPWEVEEMQRQQAYARDAQMAQMSAGNAAALMSGQAGRQIGGAIGNIGRAAGLPLGSGNPQLEQAQKMQAINKELQSSGITPADTEKYLTALGEKLAAAGMTREAVSVGEALQAHRDKQAGLDIKRAQVDVARARADAFKNGSMNKFTAEIWKDADKYTEDSFSAWQRSTKDPEFAPEGDTSLLKLRAKDTQDWMPNGMQGTGQDGKLYPVLVNKKTGETKLGTTSVEKKTGQTINLTPVTTVTATNEAPAVPTAFDEVNADILKTTVTPAIKQLGTEASAAYRVLPEIKQMKKLIGDGNVITGTGAKARTEFARFASTIGFSGLDASLNDTDFFRQFSEKAVLPYMQQLGGSDSNEELRTLRAAVATNSMTPAQIKRALDWVEREQTKVTNKWDNYRKGLNNGRKDPMMFDPITGTWSDVQGQTQQGTGKNRTTTETRTRGPVAAPVTTTTTTPAPAVVQSAPVTPVTVGAPPDNIVDKYMAKWGLSREQTIARLQQAKAAQGQ